MPPRNRVLIDGQSIILFMSPQERRKCRSGLLAGGFPIPCRSILGRKRSDRSSENNFGGERVLLNLRTRDLLRSYRKERHPQRTGRCVIIVLCGVLPGSVKSAVKESRFYKKSGYSTICKQLHMGGCGVSPATNVCDACDVCANWDY